MQKIINHEKMTHKNIKEGFCGNIQGKSSSFYLNIGLYAKQNGALLAYFNRFVQGTSKKVELIMFGRIIRVIWQMFCWTNDLKL